MSLIQRMWRQQAVWWAKDRADPKGKPRVLQPPTQIRCRWEDSIAEVLDPMGEVRATRARIYVDRDLRVGDKLMRGPLGSGTSYDPNQVGSWEVVKVDEMPNIHATQFFRTVYLA